MKPTIQDAVEDRIRQEVAYARMHHTVLDVGTAGDTIARSENASDAIDDIADRLTRVAVDAGVPMKLSRPTVSPSRNASHAVARPSAESSGRA